MVCNSSLPTHIAGYKRQRYVIDALEKNFQNLKSYSYYTDYEENYADSTLFLEGLARGESENYQKGYDFFLQLVPKETPHHEIHYYLSRNP